ncbi:hypothetical protein J0A67_13095 [Algoriphagus aestuariicola]|uniref:Carboxypeptidase regulatory-like domain-containing protein n=1 Tax=Algoriphagus aestuariicola TaxID=1852016 RepID=A0ABS3BRQ1_9BACT|nr:hypothetical protein [Algoriphagus aestuariicola]MBN7801803.1 hypothetical protein [Algoriphagus aestuariicola]
MKLSLSSTKTKMLLLSFILLSGCFNITKPTRFIGKVIDSSTNAPILEGSLIFVGTKLNVVNYILTTRDTIHLDAEGNFDWTLTPDDEGIPFIEVFVLARQAHNSEPIYLTTEFLDCSPYVCHDFAPGKTYRFDLEVTWPPEE